MTPETIPLYPQYEKYKNLPMESNVVQCPECRWPYNCGRGGIGSLVKFHLGSEKCRSQRLQKERQEGIRPNMKLSSFFDKKPKIAPEMVLPKASAPLIIHTSTMKATSTPASAPTTSTSTSVSSDNIEREETSTAPTFATEFASLVASLPSSIPEGQDGEPLAVFGGDPSVYMIPGVLKDDIWEEVVNPMLDRTLGGRRDDQWEPVIRRGGKGLGGFCEFVLFFIERGIGGILFAPRIDSLTQAIHR
jgi:hypothetical protein